MNILEIQILSAEIDQTRRFYHDILGMDILFADDKLLRLSAGLSTLVFKKTANINARYHFAFNIPANQFNEAHAWASTVLTLLPVKGSNTVADFTNWNAKAFYFYDNNQNIVELISRFDLHNNATKPFDGSSIFSISEMGLVVDHAGEYAKQLIKDYGLDYFSRQPPQEDFIALGDDHGLFIVVKDKRNWYPTGQPSGKFDATIRFRQEGKLHQLQVSGT